MTFRAISRTLLASLVVFAAACSDNEEPASHHASVASVKLYDLSRLTEVPADAAYEVEAGSTTRFEVRFYDADGNLLNEELVGTHFTSLTFAPEGFATVADVTDQPFQRDVTVTAEAGTAGTVTVGYGHDVAADEHTYGPYDVIVVAAD